MPKQINQNAGIPHEMNALILTKYGPLETGLSLRKTSTPSIASNEILVRIHAAGLNPHDYKQALGKLQKHEPLTLPAPVGADFSGEVAQVGTAITDFAVGDRVFGLCEGAIAEYCMVGPEDIIKTPTICTFEEAASLSVAGMTTVQAFRRIGGIHAGDRVLIHAGSGGVGTFAIQYAKSQGACVFTTTSKANTELVRGLGADRVIDYQNENYLDICTDIDIVFDTLGGDHTFDAFKVLKAGGRVVSIVPAEINSFVATEFRLPAIARLFFHLKPSRIKTLMKKHNATYEFVFMRPANNDLKTIAGLIGTQAVSPVIDRVFPMDQAIDALRYLAGKHAKGKVIIRTQNP